MNPVQLERPADPAESETTPRRSIRFSLTSRARGTKKARAVRWTLAVVLMFLVLLLGVLKWGAFILIADDRLPPTVEGAVVLQGSVLGQEARIAGAVRLFKQGVTPRILLSVPKESYWGQPIAPLAHDYLQRIYGEDVVNHIEFCETFNVDSTEEEAKALLECIDQRNWHNVAVVTSTYHTRRAGVIWRRILTQQHSRADVRMHAVPDPEFQEPDWWRTRRSAKSWLFEMTKLLWTLGGGN